MTLIFSRENTSEISRSRPWRSPARMNRSTGYTVSCPARPQSVWITRSGALARISAKFLQVARWIDTPLPRVTKPTMRVRRRRLAALGQHRHQAFGADHQHARLGALLHARRAALVDDDRVVRPARASPVSCSACFHMAQAEFVLADRDEQLVDLGEAQLVRQRFQVDRGLAFALQRFFDQRAAVRQRLLQVDRMEPGAHLGARAAC